MLKMVLRTMSLLGLLGSVAGAVVIHVPGDYPTIQQGIDAAVSGDIVLVAPGRYTEEILLKAGVVVRGAGEGQSIIDGGGDAGDVVRAIGNAIRSDAKLEGFTVTGAISGGGMPGGAGCFCNSGAAPDISNNRFEGNDFGIATWNGSNPTIHNNVICHNTFHGIDISSNPEVINNTICFHIIGIDDGGGYGPVVMNNIVTNSSRYGIYAVGLQPQLTYNDVWGNDTNYRNCSPGTGCISADPLFRDTANRDYHLATGSPCIDSGNPLAQYNDPDGSRNDIGAYGGPGAPALRPQATLLIPGRNELNADTGVSISAGFNLPMDPGSITDANFQTWGAWSGPHPGGINYDSLARMVTIIPGHSFSPGEPVTALLTKGITSGSGESLAGCAWQFTVAAAGGSGRFPDTLLLPVSDSSGWVVTSDFNRDGKLDFASTRQAAGEIGVYLGNGDGTFQAAITVAVGPYISAVGAGEFDSDSIVDLAVTFRLDSVAILLGTGDGHFTRHTQYALGFDLCEAVSTDFNLDGNADLAIADAEDGSVDILLGQGDGNFGLPVRYQVGGSPNTLGLGDLNSDGFPDFVSANATSGNLSVRLGNGDGTFDSLGEFACGTMPLFVRLGDFNEDGNLDAAAGDYSDGRVRIMLGTGTGALSYSGAYDAGSRPAGILVSDLDADGHLDLAAADTGGSIAVLAGLGNGVFGAAVSWPAIPGSVLLSGGDFDRDGDVDIVVSGQGLAFMPNDNQLRVQSVLPVQYATQAAETTSLAAQFNQPLLAASLDSTSFLCWGSFSGLHRGTLSYDSAARQAVLDPAQDFASGEVMTGVLTDHIESRRGGPLRGFGWEFMARIPIGSSGAFSSQSSYSTGPEPRGIAVADFDSDGGIDVATTSNAPAVCLLRNNGNGTFAAPVYTGVAGDPIALYAADLDNDGDVDLAVYHNEPGSSHLEILRNDGAGGFQVAASYSPAILGQDLAGGDFDSDGDIDLVLTDGWGSQDNVLVMNNNGNGTFSGPARYSAGTWARGVAVADIDLDGDLDLCVANSGNNNVSVLLNDGLGRFPDIANYSVGSSPNDVYAFDLDRVGGSADLAVTSLSEDSISVLLNRGDGTFAPQARFAAGRPQYYIAGGDFDGDGDVDLACTSYGCDSVAVLLNAGDSLYTRHAMYHVGSTPWGVAVADLNLDGALDIALADYGSGNISVLVATGLGVADAGRPELRGLALYPNPFRTRLVIRLPHPVGAGAVRIFDRTGRWVKELPIPSSPAGAQLLTWDGRDMTGRSLGPGVYFIRLDQGDTRLESKVVLAR